jgi:hypothetical protein
VCEGDYRQRLHFHSLDSAPLPVSLPKGNVCLSDLDVILRKKCGSYPNQALLFAFSAMGFVLVRGAFD